MFPSFWVKINEKLELLKKAARSDDVKEVSSLISEGVDLNAEINGFKAIHWAAFHGSNNVIDFLLNTGLVSVDSTDSTFYQTALHIAVANKRYSTIELLVSRNANSNFENRDKRTALHSALWHFANCSNHNNCVKDVENKYEKISLYLKNTRLKVKCAYLAIASFLIIEANADATVKDKDGKTAFDLIKTHREIIVAQLQELTESYSRYSLRSNIDESKKSIEHNERDVESNCTKVERLEHALRENSNIIMEMRHQVDDCKKELKDKDKAIVSLQSSFTSKINISKESMKTSLKQRDNKIAAIKKELAENSNASQKLNANMSDKNKEITNLRNLIKEWDSELKENRLKVKNLEEASMWSKRKFVELRKQFNDCANAVKEAKVSESSMKIALKEKEEEMRKRLQEYSTTIKENMDEVDVALAEMGKKLANSLKVFQTHYNERNSDYTNIKYKLQEKCHELEKRRIKFSKAEESLREKDYQIKEKEKNLREIKDALKVKENEIAQLKKQLVEGAKVYEDKEKLIDEKVASALREKEVEIRIVLDKLATKQEEINDFEKRFQYLESFYLCSKCGEAKISFVLLCGHKYCDDCYQSYGDSCPVDK